MLIYKDIYRVQDFGVFNPFSLGTLTSISSSMTVRDPNCESREQNQTTSRSEPEEHSVLSKHLEERAETQQQELVTTKQKLVETKEELDEAKQEIQELRENQKKFEELFHKIMEGQQPPP
ncbi:unnamed protein product [Malus baccata var. baccata]